MVAISISASS